MQLKMWRPSDLELPNYPVPEGFTIRAMRPGEEADWSYCCLGEFGVAEVTPDRFYKSIGADFPMDHVFYACKDDKPVATASAQVKYDNQPFLHYIAVNGEYRGCKLAKPLIATVLHKHASEGRLGCFLTTDDPRLPAIRTYLTMGYRPVLWSDDARERWEKVLPLVGFDRVEAYNEDMTRADDIVAAQ